jgi:hypothetical protein
MKNISLIVLSAILYSNSDNKVNSHKIQKHTSFRSKDWTLKLGDLQEHKYTNQKAWVPNGLPHKSTEHLEHVGKLMNAHFDLKAGELVSPWILRDRAEKEE